MLSCSDHNSSFHFLQLPRPDEFGDGAEAAKLPSSLPSLSRKHILRAGTPRGIWMGRGKRDQEGQREERRLAAIDGDPWVHLAGRLSVARMLATLMKDGASVLREIVKLACKSTKRPVQPRRSWWPKSMGEGEVMNGHAHPSRHAANDACIFRYTARASQR
jgi:hypothetical protein